MPGFIVMANKWQEVAALAEFPNFEHTGGGGHSDIAPKKADLLIRFTWTDKPSFSVTWCCATK